MISDKNTTMRDVPAVIIAFVVAASCLAELIPGAFVGQELLIRWLVFIGCSALVMRFGVRTWAWITIACIGVTFNPFVQLKFADAQALVDILGAIAAGAVGYMLIARPR